MSNKWHELSDGEWVNVPAKGHRNACCDCNLVHVIDYRIAEDGSLQIRFRRDKRATAKLRREAAKK